MDIGHHTKMQHPNGVCTRSTIVDSDRHYNHMLQLYDAISDEHQPGTSCALIVIACVCMHDVAMLRP